MAYAVAADNSVLTVAQFLAQSVAISTIQLNDQHIPILNGKYMRCVQLTILQGMISHTVLLPALSLKIIQHIFQSFQGVTILLSTVVRV